MAVTGLRGASPAGLAAVVAQSRPVCCIVADEDQISIFEQDFNLLSPGPAVQYPGHEIPPYTPLSPDQRITAARLASLYRMHDGSARVMVTSIEALIRRVMPREVLTTAVEYLEAGEDCDHDELLGNLDYLGYEKVSLVQSVGDYSVRGGIIDVFPPPFMIGTDQLHEGPIRIDFFGDTVDSLRSFDPFSQRSVGEIEEATLLPVTDILLSPEPKERRTIARTIARIGEENDWSSEETARMIDKTEHGVRYTGMEFFLPLYNHGLARSTSSVLDFLPEQTVILTIDPAGVFQSLDLTLERIRTNFDAARGAGSPALAPEELFLAKEEINRQFRLFKQIHVTDFPKENHDTIGVRTTDHLLLKQDISLKRSKLGLLPPLTEQILKWQKLGDRVVICCRSSRHTKNLAELLSRHSSEVQLLEPPLDLQKTVSETASDRIYLCDHPLSSGFSLLDNKLHLLSESELFGEMRLGTRSRRKQKGEPVQFTELSEGDIVVHRDHGLGIYRGLSTIEFNALTNDFMLIEYRDGDKLYLPVDRFNLISRYQGLSDREPKIDKLGHQSWKTTKAKVKEEVWKVAQELLDIYAKREIRQGHQFTPPGELFNELEESFPFDETPGQRQSINDVLDDLTSDKPMDRLVCGDVGYGKTEVAIRAAFKVVEDGRQVAILVPTTVLAEQHAKTFRERLEGFPVRISCLNRFRSSSQQRSIIKEIREGQSDIVIGTHRLLSKDVSFSKLGLLIIDEEHRFGVAHKEKMKKMRAEVDILTLTATPIPRTLQMSLLAIRDLSVISTPPEHRMPVKTFVARFDDLVIKEAVTRELRRGGQVFFVHNRVKSIHRMAAMIQQLVPEAKIAVAHGQMVGKDLEKIMVSFVNKDINVLIATTIIESGLDIPSANTIIINRADMLGLAEIYQLRGRVGRSTTQSYAYLLVNSLDSLSKDSRERLRALMDCNELGGGFKLAMNDLQIRGGGNLLGVSQSGNISAIGYDLYLDLLQKTVADLKAQAASGDRSGAAEEIDPEVNLQISAYIPKSYVPDISQRYITYRRIAALIDSSAEIRDDLKLELEDRYGQLPGETVNLMRIIELKQKLRVLRISKLEQGSDSVVFSFLEDTPLAPEKLLDYLVRINKKSPKQPARINPDGRLILTGRLTSIEHIFDTISGVLDDLADLVQQA
ncbi:transcription-repair coupling factor [Desulforhopalus singaporensis]|uniref:transcription-repair coupling factor n=1 Tax=Desulforhopalus singaporensis TaxID=91360 RepID=UPI001FDEB46F|nr:transcription-repair coupling factor [Desulforhopalus singaporensis]